MIANKIAGEIQADQPPPIAALSTSWRNRAEDLRKWAAAESAACALERAADELDRALQAESETTLTLAEAALRTGYSRDHIGRLVRTGAIQNHGRKHAPKIRLGDIKPRLAATSATGYDPISDARSLRRSAVRRS